MEASVIDFREGVLTAGDHRQRALLVGRLDRLTHLGLAQKTAGRVWAISPEAERMLIHMGERAKILRTIQRAFPGERRKRVIMESLGAAAWLKISSRCTAIALGLSIESSQFRDWPPDLVPPMGCIVSSG